MGDADAYPVAIKEILYRAASRAERPLTLIANQMLQVPSGFDLADHRIALEAEAGDVVVTTDIPLAALMVAKGATVVDPRDELLNMDNDRGSAVSEDKAIVINLIFWSLGIGPPLSMPARERAVTRPMGATGDRYPGNRREMSTFFVAL